EVIPACRAYGLGLIPWSPLGGGLLGGMKEKVGGGRRMDEDTLKEYLEARKQIDAYEALCERLGEQPADVALAWLLANPVVTAPIIGPRTIDQLKGSLRALKIHLKTGTLKELDKLFPGPGGEAPEAYAW
ncbi:MAG: aldo/keto reductase, partial [Anaerolineaceae bacterium]